MVPSYDNTIIVCIDQQEVADISRCVLLTDLVDSSFCNFLNAAMFVYAIVVAAWYADTCVYLWPPYVIGQAIYIFMMWFLLLFYFLA